jgi:hypothetical protein
MTSCPNCRHSQTTSAALQNPRCPRCGHDRTPQPSFLTEQPTVPQMIVPIRF